MAPFKPHKVVAALPAQLEPNSVYFVRVGTGVDLYVTNASGTIVAYSLNPQGRNGLITTTATALTLEQTGDVYGVTRLHLQSRNGSAGAMFESPSLDLFDFGFKGSEGYQSNIRYEHRSDQIHGGSAHLVGEFQFIDDPTGSATWFFTTNKAATVVHTGNLGVGVAVPTEKLSVAGNIAVTGTVDGRDLSADGAKLDTALQPSDKTELGNALALKAPLAGPVFTDIPRAPTPAAGNNTDQVATTAFVQAMFNALVNGAPGFLDQFNEFAAAVGNDPNFATTILNALANKQPLDSDLTAIATLTTQTFGRSILTAANAAALRAMAELGALALLGSVNDSNWSGADLSIANGGTGASSASAARDNLGIAAMALQDPSSVNITGGTMTGVVLDDTSNRDFALATHFGS